MKQNELDRQVAHATGESIRHIRRQGFSLLEVHSQSVVPELDARPPLWVDWDELDAQKRC